MAKRLIQNLNSVVDGHTHTVKVYRDSEWNEWVVIHYIDGVREGGDDSGYHTSDKKDALNTAIFTIDRI